MPKVGEFGLVNRDKVYATLPDEDIFEERGISRDGAIVVVRPDQYVSAVLPLTDREGLAEFFGPILVER